MLIVFFAWFAGLLIPDLLGLAEFLLMARFGVIKGHLYTVVLTNALRFFAIVMLFIFTKTLPASLLKMNIIHPVFLIILILLALLTSIILFPRPLLKIKEEIIFYSKKTGSVWPLFIANRYLLHIFQIVIVSFMIMILNETLNPFFSGLIAGGLWSLIDLILRNYRFGIYNILLSLILSFSYYHFGSFPINILIAIIPQII